MNCPWSEQVAMLLDEPEQTPELTAHLAECADCRELLDELRADQTLLQTPPDVPSGVVAAQVQRRIASERRRRIVQVFLAAAAAVLIAVVVFQRPDPKPVAVVKPVRPAPAAQPPRAPSARAAEAPSTTAQVRRPARQFAKTAPPGAPGPNAFLRSLEAALAEPSSATASGDSPVLVATQTADPDVVIVLVPDSKGDAYE